jgi:hypothetical protein
VTEPEHEPEPEPEPEPEQPADHALGSVFEPEPEGPRGPDLRVTVEVPRAALGHGLRAPVPERLAADGDLVERVRAAGDEPGFIVLHLPEQLPDRAMLRLRGQGGAGDEGQAAGDLLVVVQLVDRPAEGDERILARSLSRRDVGPVARAGDVDLTWWVLAGLALLGVITLGVLSVI